MPHEITVLEGTSIIKITYNDEVSLDERINMITELTLNYITTSHLKILLDARKLVKNMTETEQKLWGKYIASREEFITASVAVLDQINIHINQSSIKMAYLTGQNIQQFHCEETAIDWLSKQ
ncbi:hypothetical protein [Paraglaciecola sp. L3A3]|uniref:hypothetical protein n=1 Tax=Paraglaciecola sp. L3A3 TaxID=2686358 RepID=UPI00131C71DF|nr:hypothetical protein [Paraglaciecola sp. L3A3]